MKSAMFIYPVPQATAVRYETVKLFARELKQAGLLTAGKGGRGAPEMTVLDAARLVIALLATDKPADAVELGTHYFSKILQPQESVPLPSFLTDNTGYRFDDALAAYLDSAVDTDEAVHTFVDRNQQIGYLETTDGKLYFTSGKGENNRLPRSRFSGLRRLIGLIAADALEIAIPFYTEKRDGKSWEEVTADHSGDEPIPSSVLALLAPFKNNGGHDA